MIGGEIQYKCAYQELVEPDTLVFHPKNPKQHHEAQLAALTAYIARAGWRHRVTVSLLSGLVVAGNARVEAARRLGCLVPVEYQAFGDDAEELAHLLADNRLAELATTDTEMLGGDLMELEARGWSGSVLGFGDDSPLPDSFDPSSSSPASNPYGDIDLGDIEIPEQLALDRLTVFVAESIKAEVKRKIAAIAESYADGLVRVIG